MVTDRFSVLFRSAGPVAEVQPTIGACEASVLHAALAHGPRDLRTVSAGRISRVRRVSLSWNLRQTRCDRELRGVAAFHLHVRHKKMGCVTESLLATDKPLSSTAVTDREGAYRNFDWVLNTG